MTSATRLVSTFLIVLPNRLRFFRSRVRAEKAGADNGSLRAISDIDVTFAEGRAHHHHRAQEPEKRGPSQRMALSR
jgi:hypothetical protein